VFEAEAIVGLMAGILVEVAILIEVPSGGTGLGIGMGSKGLMNPLEDKFSYACARVIPRSKNFRQAFFMKLG